MHAGTPSVFLRTYRCNLTCTWCDTKYTWLNQESSVRGVDYESMTLDSILERVLRFRCKHLVLTGGEPLLHQRSLLPLLTDLKKAGFFIEVETNGTIAPSPELLRCVDSLNVSPKIANSLVDEKVRIRPEAIQAHVNSGKAWFKFVACEARDIVEIEELIGRLSIPRDRVILMPEGTDPSVLLERGRWLVEVCKKRGYRFSPRLHILLFGNKRGT